MYLSIEDLEKIDQAKSILEKEYKHPNTHAELAKRVNTNERKLRTNFKLATQYTIHQYLTLVRIKKAKELLEITDDPIKSIAPKVGFDVRNLEKQFKKLTGMAPLEWRKAHRIDGLNNY